MSDDDRFLVALWVTWEPVLFGRESDVFTGFGAGHKIMTSLTCKYMCRPVFSDNVQCNTEYSYMDIRPKKEGQSVEREISDCATFLTHECLRIILWFHSDGSGQLLPVHQLYQTTMDGHRHLHRGQFLQRHVRIHAGKVDFPVIYN